jgi:hypothetical protein
MPGAARGISVLYHVMRAGGRRAAGPVRGRTDCEKADRPAASEERSAMPHGDYGRRRPPVDTDERSPVRSRAGRVHFPTEDFTI